jgi:uncharacterized membrane protein YphA (DoxX/SURF4 family)
VGFFEEENKKLGEISTSGNFKRGKGLSKKLKAMDEEYADFVAKKIKPATPLLLAVIVTQLVATLITVYGILLPAMGWTLALLVLGICSATVCDNRFCKSATLQIT